MEQTNMNFTNYSKFDLVKLKEDPNKLKTHIYQSILTRTTKMDVINIIINEIIDLTSI